MKGTDFDLSTVTDSVVEAIRIRLPELITAEVKRQLSAAPVRAPTLTDAELRQRNALRAQAGLPLLPGVGSPTRPGITASQRKLRDRVLALRAAKP